MNYWLMKSEPDVYSIDDLKRDKKTYWDGVRNYQARNFMRDEMRVGDGVLYYHSNAEPAGIAGLAAVCKTGYPDFTAWDKNDIHYDPRSPEPKPQWYMVDIAFEEKFRHFITLDEIKRNSKLKDMLVVKRGMRLSVQPVEESHFKVIQHLGRQ